MTENNSIESDPFVRKIRDLAKNNLDIEVVWLYGSRATNKAQMYSDYDIAIAFKNFKLSDIERYLRPNELALEWSAILKLPEKMLSIVDINQSPSYLNYNIIEQGIVLYTNHSARLYKEQDRIYSQYEYQLKEASDEK